MLSRPSRPLLTTNSISIYYSQRLLLHRLPLSGHRFLSAVTPPADSAGSKTTVTTVFTDKSTTLPSILHLSSLPLRQSYNRNKYLVTQRRSTVLQAITGDGDEMDEYHFPDSRLKKKMDDASKTPLLLVACGSFSPITFLHLRMFVMAADYVKHNTDFEMVGGYLSPVSDAYKKQGLAPAEHR